MAVVCPSCGVENREKARFCLGCAVSLDRSGEAPPEATLQPPRRPQAVWAGGIAEGETAPTRGALTAGWVGALLLVAALAGWWVLAHPPRSVASTAQPSVPPTTRPVPVDALPAVASPGTGSSDPAPPPPSPAAVLAAERLRESVEGLAERDRVHQRELEQQRSKVAKELQRAEEARRRAEGPSMPRPVGAEPAQPATAAATAPAPGAAPAVVPGATVDQLCAGSSNFLARDFCRIRECGKPSFASDPVCVRFRQMDEARRQQAN